MGVKIEALILIVLPPCCKLVFHIHIFQQIIYTTVHNLFSELPLNFNLMKIYIFYTCIIVHSSRPFKVPEPVQKIDVQSYF